MLGRHWTGDAGARKISAVNRQTLKAHQLIAGALVVAGFLAGFVALFLSRDAAPGDAKLTAARGLMLVAVVVFIAGALWWVVARLMAWWRD